MEKPILSVVVPCYNEVKNLPSIFEKFSTLVKDEPAEVILVNNGSTDNSEQILEALRQQNTSSKIRTIKVAKNEGYGNGILRGLAAAQGSVLAWTHADLQTDPGDVITAFRVFEQQSKMSTIPLFVKGSRRKRRVTEAFFSYIMAVISSFALKTRLTEINAQPKLFTRNFYENYIKTDAPLDFSLDLFALYHAKKHCTIIEIPVYFAKRMHGEAKGGGSFKTRIKLIKRTLAYILELNRRLRSSNRA